MAQIGLPIRCQQSIHHAAECRDWVTRNHFPQTPIRRPRRPAQPMAARRADSIIGITS